MFEREIFLKLLPPVVKYQVFSSNKSEAKFHLFRY